MRKTRKGWEEATAPFPKSRKSRASYFHFARFKIRPHNTIREVAGEWTKRETGQRVTHCSCALLPRLMWSGPYCEFYCHAVCTWKLWIRLTSRPHVSVFVWKRRFFSPFSKKYASTRSLFESFSPVHTKTLNNGNTIASLTEHALG